jgi:hypothetical protein
VELLSCHSPPILSPVHASMAVLTVKPSLGILYFVCRREGELCCQSPRAKAQEPASWSPVVWPPVPCFLSPVPNLVESTSSPRVSPNLTGPLSKPRQHPANTSQQHQPLQTPPPPVRISERLSTTDSLRPPTYSPALRRTSLLQGFARSTSH